MSDFANFRDVVITTVESRGHSSKEAERLADRVIPKAKSICERYRFEKKVTEQLIDDLDVLISAEIEELEPR